MVPAGESKGLEKIDTLGSHIKNHILSFFGKIGTRDFKYSALEYKNKEGRSKYPTFYGNLLVLCSYMERAEITQIIAINLLAHVQIKPTLELAAKNLKSLAIPVIIKDKNGQWIEGTPSQILGAAFDSNTRDMKPDEPNYGLVEDIRKCFQNPKNHDKQLERWFGPGAKEATEKAMAPFVAAMLTACRSIIESKEISDDVSYEDMFTLPSFIQIAADFDQAAKPDPDYVVKQGFLPTALPIFDIFMKIFAAHVDNEKVEDKERPNLGGWWSRKSDAFEAIVFLALLRLAQPNDLGIMEAGAVHVARGKIPTRWDFSNGTPEQLSGIGTTHGFDLVGTKYARAAGAGPGGWSRLAALVGCGGLFSKLMSSKSISIWSYAAVPTKLPTESVHEKVMSDSRSAACAPRL